MVVEKNVIGTGRVFGIRLRNLAEGIVAASLVCLIVCAVPFVFKIKASVCVLLGGIAFYGNAVGIKNRSVSEFVVEELAYMSRARRLHLRGPDYKREGYVAGWDSEGESVAEMALGELKRRVEDFVREYRTDGKGDA